MAYYFTNYFTKLLTLKMYHLIDKSYTLLLLPISCNNFVFSNQYALFEFELFYLSSFFLRFLFLFLLAVHLYTNIKELTLKIFNVI